MRPYSAWDVWSFAGRMDRMVLWLVEVRASDSTRTCISALKLRSGLTVCASGIAEGISATPLGSIEIEIVDAEVPGGVQRCNAAARDAIFVKALKTFEHGIATIAADHQGMSSRKHHSGISQM